MVVIVKVRYLDLELRRCTLYTVEEMRTNGVCNEKCFVLWRRHRQDRFRVMIYIISPPMKFVLTMENDER